jgi:hypothetical protein
VSPLYNLRPEPASPQQHGVEVPTQATTVGTPQCTAPAYRPEPEPEPEPERQAVPAYGLEREAPPASAPGPAAALETDMVLDPEPEQLAQHDQSNDAAAYRTETTRLMARLNLQQEQPASPQRGVEVPAYGPELELEPER